MSDRDLGAELKATAESREFRYVVLVSLDFPSGFVRVHNGVGTHEFGGNVYEGVGGFGSVDTIAESRDLIANPVKLMLAAINDEIIDAIRNDDIYGRDADIYIGALNEDFQLSGTPFNWISGYMEKKELSIGQESGLAITIQTRAGKLKQRNNKRYTLEQHQVDYPGDLFFEFLPYVIDAQVPWGGDIVRSGMRSDNGLTGTPRPDFGRGGRRRRA
jgi:hypothetical protein